MLCAVDYLHSIGIFHRDIKPQNILINPKTKQIKLADFGLARCFTIPFGRLTKEIMTLYYRSPELLMGDDFYGGSVDVWAIGCIWAEMLIGKVFLTGDSQIDQLFKIFQVFGTPTNATYPGLTKLPFWKTTFPKFKPLGFQKCFPIASPKCLDLLEKMLKVYPRERISVRKALEHSYFADLKPPQKPS